MAEIQWIQNGRSKSLDLSPSCDYGIYGSDNPLSNAQHHELTQSSRVYLLPLIAETTTVVRRCLCVCVCVWGRWWWERESIYQFIPNHYEGVHTYRHHKQGQQNNQRTQLVTHRSYTSYQLTDDCNVIFCLVISHVMWPTCACKWQAIKPGTETVKRKRNETAKRNGETKRNRKPHPKDWF